MTTPNILPIMEELEKLRRQREAEHQRELRLPLVEPEHVEEEKECDVDFEVHF